MRERERETERERKRDLGEETKMRRKLKCGIWRERLGGRERKGKGKGEIEKDRKG